MKNIPLNASHRRDEPPVAVSSAPLFLVMAIALWSGNFVAGRFIGDSIDALTLNFWRWLIALAILAPLAAADCRRATGPIKSSWRYLAVLGLTGVAAFHVFVYKALEHTTATNALLMMSLTPALIMVLSRTFLGEIIRGWQWVGITLSFIGAAILVCRGDYTVLVKLQPGPGELWMLAAVPVWAVYSVMLKRRPTALPQRAMLTVSTVMGLLWMLPWLLFSPTLFYVDLTPSTLAALAYIGIGASVIAFLGWNRGVATIGPARSSAYLHLMPVIGTALAVVLLNESLHGYHLVGAALVFTGIAITQTNGESWRRLRVAVKNFHAAS